MCGNCVANKWIKRIKKAQDNFFDKQITYENYDEVSSFDREYIRAKISLHSLANFVRYQAA